jgi:anti-sigma regulatory factor (Ser/Thr protein kinase)
VAERVSLPAEPLSVRRARRFVSEQVIAMGFGELRASAELLTSEIVTNALVHARTDIIVGVLDTGCRLRVEVADGLSVSLPPPADPDPEATRGRGLWLIDAIATDWGVEAVEAGKLVWFELTPDGDAL